MQLKYSVKLAWFDVDVIVASKYPRFELPSNEVSSGIRYPFPCVNGMNGYYNVNKRRRMFDSVVYFTWSCLDPKLLQQEFKIVF
jgi:hypothetical protein